MNRITTDEVLHRIGNLPSLPVVVMELLATLDREDAHVDALAGKITQDQALTAKTLRLANSSFYGMVRQVTTIQDAIAIVGFRTVRSLATTAALMGSFEAVERSSFKVAPFWRHALAAAVCARVLAHKLNLNPEYAYTAALLHDIGRLVLVTQFSAQFEAVMVYREQHDCPLLQAERDVLGMDHATVGQALTRHWKFPEAMQQAVACHHDVASEALLPLTRVVIAANVIVHALDLSTDESDAVPALPAGLWQQLGLSEAALLDVLRETEAQFQAASVALNF